MGTKKAKAPLHHSRHFCLDCLFGQAFFRFGLYCHWLRLGYRFRFWRYFDNLFFNFPSLSEVIDVPEGYSDAVLEFYASVVTVGFGIAP